MNYVYQSAGSLRPAGAVLVVALLLAVLLPEASLRLLALFFALSPLVWGSYELARRRTGLTLEADALVLRRPVSVRPLRIPYAHVGGAMPWPRPPRLALVYYAPRPPFEDDEDPRPPRLRVTITEPLADLPAALDDLRGRIEQARTQEGSESLLRPLTNEELTARLRAHRFRRLSLRLVLLLATPLMMILVVRIVFTLLGALHFLLK